MSVPSQPSEPQRRSSALGAGTPRPASPDPILTPPLIPPAELPDDAELEEREDGPAPTQETPAPRRPRLGQPPRGKRLARPPDNASPGLTAEQRLLLLDTWRRSGLPAGDFAALVGPDTPYLAEVQAPTPARRNSPLLDRGNSRPHCC